MFEAGPLEGSRFDIKSTAESGTLSQTHTISRLHMSGAHTRYTVQDNYTHVAESSTIKISEGACFGETGNIYNFSCFSCVSCLLCIVLHYILFSTQFRPINSPALLSYFNQTI